jgi:predicted metalloprotease with PDZ domain
VVVGFLFDAWNAASSNGSKHLDDVMQYLWRTNYKNKALGEEGAGITEKDFLHAVKTVILSGKGNPDAVMGSGFTFDQFAKQLLHSTEIPDYSALMKAVSIDTKITQSNTKKFGLTCELSAGKTIVKGIHAHPMATGFQLGVNVNDELIAINGVRIENNIDDLFLKLGEPQELTLLVNRAGLLRECKGNSSAYPEIKYEFQLPVNAKNDGYWDTMGAIQTLLK